MILIDRMGHMVSTQNAEELHAFADKLGLKRRWYQSARSGEQHAHYDLTSRHIYKKAVRFGARQVDPSDLVRCAWWNS